MDLRGPIMALSLCPAELPVTPCPVTWFLICKVPGRSTSALLPCSRCAEGVGWVQQARGEAMLAGSTPQWLLMAPDVLSLPSCSRPALGTPCVSGAIERPCLLQSFLPPYLSPSCLSSQCSSCAYVLLPSPASPSSHRDHYDHGSCSSSFTLLATHISWELTVSDTQ